VPELCKYWLHLEKENNDIPVQKKKTKDDISVPLRGKLDRRTKKR
jgi:hypothetical protein